MAQSFHIDCMLGRGDASDVLFRLFNTVEGYEDWCEERGFSYCDEDDETQAPGVRVGFFECEKLLVGLYKALHQPENMDDFIKQAKKILKVE